MLTKAILERIPIYLRFLTSDELKSVSKISSAVVAKGVNLGEVQVRKDFALLSGAGKAKIGYDKRKLIESLYGTLNSSDEKNAIIVGAGKIGKALLEYNGFMQYGIKVVAAFDTDDEKMKGDARIYHINEMDMFCKQNKAEVAIIAVPEDQAQIAFDQAIRCGIRAILNFVPVNPKVPSDIVVKNENIAASLAALFEQLKDESVRKK